MQKIFLVVGFMACACLSFGSSPLFPLLRFNKQHALLSTDKKAMEEARPDFSGRWQGECNQQKVEDLVIVQKPTSITLAYGGIKETYSIAELSSTSSSNKCFSESSSVSVSWSQEHNALIFMHSLNFLTRESNSASTHFSKSSMQLEQSNLLINAQYFSSSNTLELIQQDALHCIYQKK